MHSLSLSFLPSTAVLLHYRKSCTFWAVCACWVIDSKLSLVTTTMHAMRRMYHFPYYPVLPVVLNNKESGTFCAECACRVIFSKLSLVTTTMQAMHIIYHFSYYPVLPVVLHNKESGTFCTMHARLYLLVLAWDQ
jgi:hypothetical protein